MNCNPFFLKERAMTENEIKDMKEIINEYLEKIRGYEADIRETPECVEMWAKDPDMQVSVLHITAHSLANSGFYSNKALELIRQLSDRIKARRKQMRVELKPGESDGTFKPMGKREFRLANRLPGY